MRERRWILRVEDEMLGVFVGRDRSEVFTSKEINLIKEFL
jgi:hypothetical protein